MDLWKRYAGAKGKYPFNAETTIDFLAPEQPEISFKYPCFESPKSPEEIKALEDTAYFFHLGSQYSALVLGTFFWLLVVWPSFEDFAIPIIEQALPPANYFLAVAALVGGTVSFFLVIAEFVFLFGSISILLHRYIPFFQQQYANTNAIFRIPIRRKIDLSKPYTKKYIIHNNILTYFEVSFLQFDLEIPDEILEKISKIKTISTKNRGSIFASKFCLIIEFKEVPKEGIIELIS